MAKEAEQHPLELPEDLIQQYKLAIERIDDLRLVVLLVFNAFEEVMKSLAGWRLSCPVSDLPTPLKNNTSLLLSVVLSGGNNKEVKKLRDQGRQLCELRNTVAHKFHLRTYKDEVAQFVQAVSNQPCPELDAERRVAFMDAVSGLALDIASHVSDTGERGDIPVPLLNLELTDIVRSANKKKVTK